MARYAYERLSYEDNSFLWMESPTLPMHVAGIQVFRTGSLRNADGGVDFDSIRRLTESVLHRIPRYSQRLMWLPGDEGAVWIDDSHFNLDYHLRQTALPRPGSETQLKTLASRIVEVPLDRARPLWESWVVEGLEGDRFAVVTKIHHCMIDGAAGVDISQILNSPTPTREIRPAPRFIPRPTPSPSELRRHALLRRVAMPLRSARELLGFATTAEDPIAEAGERLRAVREAVSWQTQKASPTPINGPVGPHRSVDWMTSSLDDLRRMRRALECSINDVVLTVVTGAVREFMIRRQVRPEDLDFRVATPVNVRSPEEQGRMGNRVSSWTVPLPLGESDPLRQLSAIQDTTLRLKESRQAIGVELMMKVLDTVSVGLPSVSGAFNAIVTNVPGPQFPLFLLEAELEQCFPLAPLLEEIGLAIGVFSYDGRLCWGFAADYDRIPDLASFVALVRDSIGRVADAAGVELEEGGPRPVAERAAPAGRRRGAKGKAPAPEGVREARASTTH